MNSKHGLLCGFAVSSMAAITPTAYPTDTNGGGNRHGTITKSIKKTLEEKYPFFFKDIPVTKEYK